jgi:hypothetical protein
MGALLRVLLSFERLLERHERIPSASVILIAADNVCGVPITGAMPIRMFWT